MNSQLKRINHHVDVCVVGGGMTGLIAAVAAARRGSSVLLVHDRPVLGGNASSEIRMWICGAFGANKKETGILEEIQLVNAQRNPDGLYSVWDSVLFEFAYFTPGLTTLLNCSCNDGRVEKGRLASIDAWQLSTQSWHRIEARFFIDCSGDSILAPLSGAETRCGRESREEFGEEIAPIAADLKTMGNTVLLQLEETPSPKPFSPPSWAYRFDDDSNLPSRIGNTFGHNFWWLELGGLKNTIADAEFIHDELIKTAWGTWDYMKNRGPQAEKLTNWRLRWMGALPGKRESRRYIGQHTLTQHDIEAGGNFDDIVAYGGWSMDDHHPAGLYYPGAATIFHPAPSPYGIPLRCLYSRNVPNLFCAGRNISATHCALSSTRVMATCSLLGQAVGTAAALCVAHSIEPNEIAGPCLDRLQEQLMEDDCWLPGRIRPVAAPMNEATLNTVNAACLTDGHERNADGAEHAWSAPLGSDITLEWSAPQYLDCLRLVLDSDLNAPKRMPCTYSIQSQCLVMPKQLIRNFKVEAQCADGIWEVIHEEVDNRRRLVVLPINREVRALRWTGESTWGAAELRVFSIEARARPMPLSQTPPPGQNWNEVVAGIPPADLAEPDHGLEGSGRGTSRFGA
ncbi:FAD-dependent oxidoreductase [Coraliomargarita parva]|uniref:FAD-dependent oxidoreductase n=1 Tax=Coraliomargarita parva TaxID=3014050 RepID=UPI0022B52190|nr:FAD-dependent oxidoreductase [Coraliomargarita parva]